MLKIANQVVDAYDDVGHEQLRKLAAERPDCYLRTADECAVLPDHAFALSVITKKASKLNKFPIATADDTWLSSRFFDMNYPRLPKEAAEKAAFFIKKACARFALKPTEAVEAMAKEAASNVYFEADNALKPATVHREVDLSKFAEAQKIGDNYTHAQYVMATPSHVKVAAQYFDDMHGKMPLEVRHKYATAIQTRAHELGMPVQGGVVGKYASDHYSGQVDGHLRSRVSLLHDGNTEARGAYEKLGMAKKAMAPREFAQALHGIDKMANLSRYYGGILQDPYLATFGQEPDRYAGWRHKTASSMLEMDDLQKLAIGAHKKIATYFGSHMADEFKKHPVEIFESLPMDAKQLMVQIAEGNL